MRRVVILLMCVFLFCGCSSQRIEKSRLEKLKGSFDSSTYINGYFNISASFDSSWQIMDVEDNGSKGTSFVVFYAQKDYGLQSVNISIEDVNYNDGEEDLIYIVWNSLKKDLKNSGVDLVSENIEEFDYRGNKAFQIDTQGSLLTNEKKIVDAYVRQYVFEKNRYLAIITLASLNENRIQELSSCFNHLNR
ncbi:MAG: hypothetical protein Q4C49_14330 [Bacillota bacterium]|nr:hypothetical protein [Bacillota bacterium]